MRRLKLLFQRLMILALGAVTVWLIGFVFFDFADQRLPWVLAIAVTYGLSAYVILPYAIRIGLRILRRGRVPSYTLTGDGLPGDPVNLVLIGTRQQLRDAFASAGWAQADALGLRSSWGMVRAFVLNKPYPTAPFSTLFLFGRGQDVGFQRAIDDSPRKRHHVRFWGLPLAEAERTIDSPSFWLDSEQPAEGARALWVGAGTKDIGLSFTPLSFQVTHATDSDTNVERDYIIAQLASHHAIGQVSSYRPGDSLTTGKVNHYVTDGQVAMADLTPAA